MRCRPTRAAVIAPTPTITGVAIAGGYKKIENSLMTDFWKKT
jgi:hypothetical protein